MVLMIFTMDTHFQPLIIQCQIHLQQLGLYDDSFYKYNNHNSASFFCAVL